MKVESTREVSGVPQSQQTLRLHEVKRLLKAHGSVILQDNKEDLKIVEILEKQLGESLSVERSKSIKVSLK